MNFILNLVRKIKRSLQSIMNVTEDPFLLEEVTVTRLSPGLFKMNKECSNCDNLKPCIRACKKCKVYICSTCFVRFIIDEISFKSLCRRNHMPLLPSLVLENEEQSFDSTLGNFN